MPAYKKLLIQQQTFDGTTYTNVGSVVDTYTQFNVVCREFPFNVLPKAKEAAKRSWVDEDGDDEFIPTDGIKIEAYEIDVTFLYSGDEEDMASDLNDFISFIYGRNADGSPLLAIYDEYTGIGRRNVRVLEVSNELFFYNDCEIDAISSFKVKFKVNDPVTEITLTDE